MEKKSIINWCTKRTKKKTARKRKDKEERKLEQKIAGRNIALRNVQFFVVNGFPFAVVFLNVCTRDRRNTSVTIVLSLRLPFGCFLEAKRRRGRGVGGCAGDAIV